MIDDDSYLGSSYKFSGLYRHSHRIEEPRFYCCFCTSFLNLRISGDGHDGALPVYTIQGIYVGALGVEDLQSLSPGLYIRDGKKLHVPMHGM